MIFQAYLPTIQRFIAIVGLGLFATLFAFTYGVPQKVEDSAKSFVKNKIEEEVLEKYENIKGSSLTQKALTISENLGLETKRIEKSLDENLPEKIAEIMAKMCGYDCEKKKAFAANIKNSYIDRLKDISVAQHNLTDIVKDKYLNILGNLKLDLRIFLGANAVMFLLVLLISILKKQVNQHLLIPSLLLIVATVLASVIYLFGQNWFYTILYNNYVGFGYLFYIGLIFGFLIDITLNKARVTSHVYNFFANALSSVASVSPC